MECAAGVEQEHAGRTLDQPAAVQTLDAFGAHAVQCGCEHGIGGLLRLDLHGGGFVHQRADEGVSITILCDGDGDLGFYDGVDASDLVGDLPSTFEEKMVLHVALWRFCGLLSHDQIFAVRVSGKAERADKRRAIFMSLASYVRIEHT